MARIALPGPTTEPPPPGRGRTRPAGPRGGAGRQLDPAAIYGPFRRAGASSGRSLSHGLHNGAAAAVEPPPPRLEACTGATPDRGGAGVPDPFIHPSTCSPPSVFPSTHPSVFLSVYPPTHPSTAPPPAHAPMHFCIPRTAALHSQRPSPRAAWLGWTTGTPRPDGTPAAAAPAPPAPSGTRVSAGLARPAPPRPGRTHRGPFFWAPRNHMSNPRRRSSPPLIQAQNVPQQRTIATLFVSIMDANRARKKKSFNAKR